MSSTSTNSPEPQSSKEVSIGEDQQAQVAAPTSPDYRPNVIASPNLTPGNGRRSHVSATISPNENVTPAFGNFDGPSAQIRTPDHVRFFRGHGYLPPDAHSRWPHERIEINKTVEPPEIIHHTRVPNVLDDDVPTNHVSSSLLLESSFSPEIAALALEWQQDVRLVRIEEKQVRQRQTAKEPGQERQRPQVDQLAEDHSRGMRADPQQRTEEQELTNKSVKSGDKRQEFVDPSFTSFLEQHWLQLRHTEAAAWQAHQLARQSEQLAWKAYEEARNVFEQFERTIFPPLSQKRAGVEESRSAAPAAARPPQPFSSDSQTQSRRERERMSDDDEAIYETTELEIPDIPVFRQPRVATQAGHRPYASQAQSAEQGSSSSDAHPRAFTPSQQLYHAVAADLRRQAREAQQDRTRGVLRAKRKREAHSTTYPSTAPESEAEHKKYARLQRRQKRKRATSDLSFSSISEQVTEMASESPVPLTRPPENIEDLPDYDSDEDAV